MSLQFTHPLWLLALLLALPWVVWLTLKSDVQVSQWRRWTAFALRLTGVLALVLALSGVQWKKPVEGMNTFFLIDRSESVPSGQQEKARAYVNKIAGEKEHSDQAGVVVFGSEANIELSPAPRIDLAQFQAVVQPERTDIAAAIRLAAAAFPETGQKRIVLLSDGNENVGDAASALLAAKGVSLDVVPQGATRGNDVSVRKLSIPSTVKKGQTFDVKIFAQADHAQTATLRLYQNEQFLGEQKIDLAAGKNLFTFPQNLSEPGFYSYHVELEAPGDTVPQNNRATAFTSVRGNPRVLVVSSKPEQDGALATALQGGKFEVKLTGPDHFPNTLAEIQSYDEIFLSNVAAGDLGMDSMRLLESAVRDFGMGLVCIGGDQAFAAGGYRGTPLETVLPVDMELNSKKVLPSGALVIVCHATEFPNGNAWARDIAFAALDALGPQDEMGIVLWDGNNRWLFPLDKVGNKAEMGRQISGMNPGDMGDFEGPMQMAYDALSQSHANLKHIVVFSDGDPAAARQGLIDNIIGKKMTISTVMIGGHVAPDKMEWMANQGHGRFYDVRSPDQLPQIFIKEAAVILKSAISEEPFKPQLQVSSELVKGIGAGDYPLLQGYVCSTPKARAEIPLVTQKGDPLLAHWQYGLGRAVAFTSDAKAKWAGNWLGWDHYRQFWTQIAQWSLRRVEVTDFTTDVTIDKGVGRLSVEAIDAQGNFRNFLNLQTMVVSPKGVKQKLHLEQTGPGHYEITFPTKEVGAYLLNLMQMDGEKLMGSQALGVSVNCSPEFDDAEPNLHLLKRLAEIGEGKVLNPAVDNPFKHDRKKTFQPRDLWEWLLKLAIVLFPLDVAVRRIQLDREEWLRATKALRRRLFFWKHEPRPASAEEPLTALLNRRDKVRSTQTAPAGPNPDLFRPVTMAAPVESAKPEERSEPVAQKEKVPGPPESTTSKLLDAKRRARKKID